MTRWTSRCARMLAAELKLLAAERTATTIDGGIGAAAIAAIAACEPGPRRELEVATWARRVIAGPGRIAIAIDPDATDGQLDALLELHARVMRATERAA